MNHFTPFPGNTRKAVLLSFDDGGVEDRRLVDILNRYGLRGTFHLCSGKLGEDGYVAAAELPSLYRGHEVACHTRSHAHLARLPLDAAAEEIAADRRRLSELAGYPVRGFSYPYGEYTAELTAALPGLGIAYARKAEDTGGFTFPENLYLWRPTCRHRDRLLKRTRAFLKAPGPGLLFVWGHSYEFQRDGSWQLMEDFGKLVGGRTDIWYTTCIEFVEHMRNPEG